MTISTANTTGDEDFSVTFNPEDYEFPESFSKHYRKRHQKQVVTVTAEQVRSFGRLGAQWQEIERFFNVSKENLKLHFKAAYDRGFVDVNMKLRQKMVDMALDGHPTMLIWLGKNRLSMSDNGPTDEDNVKPVTNELNVTLNVMEKPSGK